MAAGPLWLLYIGASLASIVSSAVLSVVCPTSTSIPSLFIRLTESYPKSVSPRSWLLSPMPPPSMLLSL